MPAQHRIMLTAEEERTLKELRQAQTVPARVRERAHIVRLNAQGNKTAEIAKIFECHEHTVRATVKRWECRGLGGLWESSGRGAKAKWTPSDLEYIEQCLLNVNGINSNSMNWLGRFLITSTTWLYVLLTAFSLVLLVSITKPSVLYLIPLSYLFNSTTI